MPTPSKGYFLSDGTRVPGTTTIIGFRKEVGGLMHWAWNVGKQGLDYREQRDQAANLGTIVHDMAERYVHGDDPWKDVPSRLHTAVEDGFEAFLEWWKGLNLKVYESEAQLVSEQYHFGGTPDLIATDPSGRLHMVDYKTGGVYYDAIIQVAAYTQLWNENRDRKINGRYHIIRFGRGTGDFVHRSLKDIEDGWNAFVHMRAIYEICKDLQKRVK